jgi:hypothetical protein
VQAEKIGMVWTEASLSPFTGYQVKDFWITALLLGEKITFETARFLYLKAIVRAELNIRQLDFVQKSLESLQAAREKARFELEILRAESEFQTLPSVEEWKLQYSKVKSRYLFLVLDGKSQTGKTRFAYSLSPPPTSEVDVFATSESARLSTDRQVYYADCSGGLPDLRGFRRAVHRLLVLDEISCRSALLLKKILQASNDDCLMGASPTMQHAYVVNTYRTMIVITTNTWSSGLSRVAMPDHEWLTANSVYVEVTAPLWKVMP